VRTAVGAHVRTIFPAYTLVSRVPVGLSPKPHREGSRRPRRVPSFSRYAAISNFFRHNEQIRISPVRLIDHNDNQVGVVPTAEALRMSREAGLDLVEVAPNARPPVCKILDYGKWRYQQQKKESKSRTSSKAGQLKEMKIKTVKIGDHDLQIKIDHAKEFLAEGSKVQFTLQFRGREMAHLDLGRTLMNKIKAQLAPISKVERDGKMEGKRMTMVLMPENKGSSGGEKKPAAPRPAGASRPATSGASLNIPVPAGS
jgi:translation initiation factor IF-3